MTRSLSQEVRRLMLQFCGAAFLCSFPFIFVCWWLHTWAAMVLPVVFSIGYGTLFVVFFFHRGKR